MEVKIVDYGFSEEFEKYYITYQVKGLNPGEIAQLQVKVEDPLVVKCDELYLTTFFHGDYYPFHSADAKDRMEDYIAREEIEMTAYILDLLDESR
ncbi:DUF5750 family protein [Methanobacterium sp. CWC-01]|uniref:DUF5750 family protein n=1 Tax=Methanobacterium aridiramus TaxID=2584467 RepID=UPI002574D5C0|nr:DUF5750 family protein [Methanobacterium sp. CWC-01]